jgi:glycosyltransferase involved in cell wall biosynthesis
MPFVRRVLDKLLVETDGPEGEKAWRSIAYVLSQAFHCRIPTTTTAADLRAAYEAGSIPALHRALVENADFSSSPQAAAPLVALESPGLAVDVSETTRIQFTTGIQRVVRSVARHLPDAAPTAMLVRWSDRTQCFTPLSEAEVERVVLAEQARPQESPESDSVSALSTIHRIQRAALWPTREIERTIRRQRQKAHRKRPVQPSVFFWNDALLLPELVVGDDHVDAVRFLAGATPIRSTMVFYDAIPIRYPEFFASATLSMYLRSVSLARDVNMVSCISHTVREHLESILDMLPAPRHPRLAVHALGADLPDQAAAVPASFERPAVLCVGTVEPRKNHLRILDAMRLAQLAGSQFTGVFVGNAGWLNGRFRTAFADAAAAGHDLVLRENVTNAELRGLYAASALTMYCSLDEGFGLPIIESLRHGRPCITSDRGSMREVADQTGGCRVVDPESVPAIAAALAGLIDDPAALAKLTLEAKKARWPTWREYTDELVQFALQSAIEIQGQRRAA